MSHPYHETPGEEDRCSLCRQERREIKIQEDADAIALRLEDANDDARHEREGA